MSGSSSLKTDILIIPKSMVIGHADADTNGDQEETWTLHPEVRASSPELKASTPPFLAKPTLPWWAWYKVDKFLTPLTAHCGPPFLIGFGLCTFCTHYIYMMFVCTICMGELNKRESFLSKDTIWPDLIWSEFLLIRFDLVRFYTYQIWFDRIWFDQISYLSDEGSH